MLGSPYYFVEAKISKDKPREVAAFDARIDRSQR
jgi:hypothetical protein